MQSGFSHLMSECKSEGLCKSCKEPVKQGPNGRWYITMGHPGFNSAVNNRSGYQSKVSAVKAYKNFSNK